MQIGELAEKGVATIQTLRFYEREGLMPSPRGDLSGYRVHNEGDLRWLIFIRQAKILGFSLPEIHDILRMREQGECPCGSVVILAEQHLRTVERHFRQISHFRGALRQALKRWKRTCDQRISGDAYCRLIESTVGDSTKQRIGTSSLDFLKKTRLTLYSSIDSKL